MTPERAHLLAELLEEMHVKDKGFIPDGAWLAVQKAFALPYVEVLVATDGWPPKFLLTYRHDSYWHGWHIPGGIWRTRHTQAEAVRSVAKQELGIAVEFVTEVMTEKWGDHPYGNPISHVCLARALEPVVETPERQFFLKPPSDTIIHHGDFVERAIAFLARVRRAEIQKLLMERN